MSGELARAVRQEIETDLNKILRRGADSSPGDFWIAAAFPYRVVQNHEWFKQRDERVPIPPRGKDG